MTPTVLSTAAATLVAGYLMLVAGLAKKHLEWRPARCSRCGHSIFAWSLRLAELIPHNQRRRGTLL